MNHKTGERVKAVVIHDDSAQRAGVNITFGFAIPSGLPFRPHGLDAIGHVLTMSVRDPLCSSERNQRVWNLTERHQ